MDMRGFFGGHFPDPMPPRQHAFEVSRNGLVIRGTAYVPGAGRHPTAVFLHGFTGHRVESGFMFVRLARHLNTLGIAAVTFDFTHSGESDGAFERMLVTGELADALHVSEWVTHQPFVDRSRLGLVGFSLGGLLACCTQARCGLFKAMALLAPTTVENLSRYASNPNKAVGPHTLHPDFFSDLATLDPIGDCVRRPRPTLVVIGTGDTAAPPAVNQRFVDAMRAAGVPVVTETIDGADHVFASPQWRQRLYGRVGAFLSQTL